MSSVLGRWMLLVAGTLPGVVLAQGTVEQGAAPDIDASIAELAAPSSRSR